MLKFCDQDYAMEAYAEEKARKREIKSPVEVYQEVGISLEETIQRLSARFSLKAEEASKYVRRFWKK